jgi:hypothetical protein
MREASECLKRATECETMARTAQDSSTSRAMRDIAGQWRQLAQDTDRHKRITGKSSDDSASGIELG